MFIYGVINASPDSRTAASIVSGVDEALARARELIADGADGLDLGGQGSTPSAELVSWQREWEILEPLVPALAGLGLPLSVDTWKPEVARRAFDHGATVLNAADGMQDERMWEIAAEFEAPVVLPFLPGPHPKAMQRVTGDPIAAISEFFASQLERADRYGMRRRCMLDPGTGFAPADWPWEDRKAYQMRVYANLDALRRFELPIYIALPHKQDDDHLHLLDTVLASQPEVGRAHFPRRVRARMESLGLSA